MNDNVEATRSAIEAMMKGDRERMAESIGNDAVWHIPGDNPFSGDYTGRDAIMQRFAKMAEAGADVTVDEIHDVVGNDEHVVALVHVTIQGPGGETSQPSIWIFHGRDGIATELWAFNRDQPAIDRVLKG